MDAGLLVGTMFFLLLSVAAITSAISLLEPAVAYMEEATRYSRRAMALTVGGVCWFVGLASAFSFNDWSAFYPLAMIGLLDGKTVFDVLDFVATSWVQPGVGIMMAVFVGWALSRETVMEALNMKGAAPAWFGVWYFLVRIVCPLAVLVIFASAVWPEFVTNLLTMGGE